MKTLDEMNNETLSKYFTYNDVSADDINNELERTVDVINKHILSGTSLEYWFIREPMLKKMNWIENE